MKVGQAFAFEPPSGWSESRSGQQHIFSSPNEEVLIVSGFFVESRDLADPSATIQQLLASAKTAILNAARHSKLREIAPLALRAEFEPLLVWTQHNVTTDGTVAFSQAAVPGEHGVLLFTLESPAALGNHVETFKTVIATVSQTTPDHHAT